MNNTEKIKLSKLSKEELIVKIQKLEHSIFDLKGQVKDLKKQLKKERYEKERDGNLELIPDNRLSDMIEYIEESKAIDTICHKCESFISIKSYPYAYDSENNNMVYVSKCPNCGEILYSRD